MPYDFFPSGSLSPSYTSKRATFFNIFFSVDKAKLFKESNEISLFSSKAKSLLTPGYFGISVYLILFFLMAWAISLKLNSA